MVKLRRLHIMVLITTTHKKSDLALKAFEIISLLLTVSLFVLKVVICLVLWWGNPSLLLLNVSLPEALRNESYKLTIAPAEFVYALWPFLYLCEMIWIMFAWTFVCRQSKQRTIFFAVYPVYWFVCLLNIAWAVSWSSLFPELGLAFGALQSTTLILCIAMISVRLYFISDDLKYVMSTTLWFTRIVVLNIFAAYTAWSLVLTLFNLGSVLQYTAQLHQDTTSTIVLSLLGSITVTYFLLECTILDWFLRNVVVVYLVVGWSLVGVVVANWSGERDRNELFSLVLASVCGALTILRMFLLILFKFVRPLREYEKEEEEKLPF